MYLSYNEYKNIGGELSETAFKRYNMRAECYLDGETFGRIKELNSVPDTVRYCLRDIIDMFASKSGNNVSSLLLLVVLVITYHRLFFADV